MKENKFKAVFFAKDLKILKNFDLRVFGYIFIIFKFSFTVWNVWNL